MHIVKSPVCQGMMAGLYGRGVHQAAKVSNILRMGVGSWAAGSLCWSRSWYPSIPSVQSRWVTVTVNITLLTLLLTLLLSIFVMCQCGDSFSSSGKFKQITVSLQGLQRAVLTFCSTKKFHPEEMFVATFLTESYGRSNKSCS